MTDKVLATIARHGLFPNEDPIVVAVSGGADSMALLHFLYTHNYALTVVHVNHGIRGEEARRDADFVRAVCEKWKIPFVLHAVNVPELAEKERCGLEECARRVRYKFLEEEALRRNAWIATAHTASDQAETVILNLTRGSGSRGMCGIPYRRGKIMRPLLDCAREEIETYCIKNEIDYIVDSTNCDIRYARNRIRHRVLPELRQMNPRIEQAVVRLIGQMSEQENFITREAEKLLYCADRGAKWDTEVLGAAEKVICDKALLLLCDQFGTGRDTAEHHIEAIRTLLRKEGAVNLPGGYRVICRNQCLSFQKPVQTKEKLTDICFQEIPEMICWGDRIFRFKLEIPKNEENTQKVYKKSLYQSLNYDTISRLSNFTWRSRRAGDEFHPAGRCNKLLKKLFNESKIPPEQRSDRAVFEADGEIIWVEGFGASETAWAKPGCPRLIIMEEKLNAEPDECGY